MIIMVKSKAKNKNKKMNHEFICHCCSQGIDGSGLTGVLFISGKEYTYNICKPCVHKIPGFKAGKATEERKQFWKDLAVKLVKLKK